MDRMTYRIVRTYPDGVTVDIHPSAFTRRPNPEWTQATAVDYALLGVSGCPAGTMHEIQRRRGGEGEWQRFHVYEVDRRGVSRRIDNRGSLRGGSLALAL